MAEYSVGRLEAMARTLRDGTALLSEIDDAAGMLTAYAERIKADEVAVVVAHRFLAPDGTAVTEWDDGLPDHGKAFPDLCPVIGSVQYAYDRPPAQAPRCDKPGCNCAAWLPDGCAWDTAEPVAQGEVVDPLQDDGPLQSRRAFVESWRLESAGSNGHDLIANRNTVRRLVHIIDGLAAQPRAVPDVRAMADRLMGWRLPDDFRPDCGISFDPESLKHWSGIWPVGTNLFTADQAEQMFRYVLAAAPSPGESKVCNRDCDGIGPCKMGGESS